MIFIPPSSWFSSLHQLHLCIISISIPPSSLSLYNLHLAIIPISISPSSLSLHHFYPSIISVSLSSPFLQQLPLHLSIIYILPSSLSPYQLHLHHSLTSPYFVISPRLSISIPTSLHLFTPSCHFSILSSLYPWLSLPSLPQPSLYHSVYFPTIYY